MRALSLTMLVAVLGASGGWLEAAPRQPAKASMPSEAPSPSSAELLRAEPVKLVLSSITWEQGIAYALDARGKRHRLTLERAAQTIAIQLLRAAKAQRGAFVAISIQDAKLLALAEAPNNFAHESSLVWSALTPSASLFKLVTTAALIERAQIAPDHRVCSEGGEHRLEWRHLEAPKQGRVVCSAFSEILGSSRNAAYARLVHTHLSAEDLDNFADRFGFNAALPADVQSELGHFRPTNDPLTLVRTATGFVGSKLSTIGAAYLGFVVARGGLAPQLQLLDDGSEGADGPLSAARDGLAPEIAPDKDPIPAAPSRIIALSTATRLREMMERVVSHGTAADAFHDDMGRPLPPSLRVAGKTGTLGREERTESWFVGFVPSRSPKVAIAVLLDNGPLWHTTAKRVASAWMQRYFDEQRNAPVASK